MQSKKQLILLILNELNVNSDEKRPLSQTNIAKTLAIFDNLKYNVTARNSSTLQRNPICCHNRP